MIYILSDDDFNENLRRTGLTHQIVDRMIGEFLCLLLELELESRQEKTVIVILPVWSKKDCCQRFIHAKFEGECVKLVSAF